MMNKPDEIHTPELDENLRVKNSVMVQDRPQTGVQFDDRSDRGMVRRFQLKALSIGSDDIADNSITGPKIAANAVSNTKIASFNWNKGTGGTISNAVFSGGTVTGAFVTLGTVSGASFGTINITGGTITSAVINSATIGTPAMTGGTITSATLSGSFDGWVADTNAWTYASAQTFTVSGDVTAQFINGTRLKFTQTTVKYGVVISATYSNPNTTVTIATNDDYSIANAAISAQYYSYQLCPQGYPDWYTWTPTITPGGSMTVTNSTLAKSVFRVDGDMCSVEYSRILTYGGTASNSVAISLPVPAATIRNTFSGDVINGVARASTFDGTTAVTMYKYDGTNFSLSSYHTSFIGSYRI